MTDQAVLDFARRYWHDADATWSDPWCRAYYRREYEKVERSQAAKNSATAKAVATGNSNGPKRAA